MSKISIPDDVKGKELFDFLVANKKALMAEKKFRMKEADGISFSAFEVNESGILVKSVAKEVEADATKMDVTSVINTTNIMDSHKDVHIPGIWKKSISENKMLYLLQEHQMTFRGIITDEVKAYTRKMLWRELGLDVYGETEALIFESKLNKSRNEFMFDQYRLKRVKNHSAGMQYVQLFMAINDESYKEEFAVWNKYIDQVINRDEAEDAGYFWPVTEAKIIEGSAVPIGSNRITPTQSVKADTPNEPDESTQEEPLKPKAFDVDEAIRNLKFNF